MSDSKFIARTTSVALGLIALTIVIYFMLRPSPPAKTTTEAPLQKTERRSSTRVDPNTSSTTSEKQKDSLSRRDSENWDLRIPQDAIAYHWDILDYDAAENIFAMWLADNAEAAFEFVANVQPPIMPDHFGTVMQNYVETLEPEVAMALVSKLKGHPQLQESVSANVFARWTGENLEEAIDWLRQLPDEAWRDALAHRNGRTGKFGDPEKSLQWMLQETDEQLASQLVSGVLENWLLSDVDSATEYLNNRAEASPAYDQAIALFVGDLLHRDPSVALSWAEAIENESLRTMIINHLGVR